jgi:hypothetical protein
MDPGYDEIYPNFSERFGIEVDTELRLRGLGHAERPWVDLCFRAGLT